VPVLPPFPAPVPGGPEVIKLFSPTSGTAPHVEPIAIGGHPFEVHGWTMAEWEMTEEGDRPGDAFPLGTMGFIRIVAVGRSG
jgi:hypothetical protein